MGRLISEDYADGSFVMIVLAKGALFFAADLMREIKTPMQFEFVSAHSYQGKKSSGKVIINANIRTELRGRRILIVDEILDTGRTMSQVIKILKKMCPAEIRTCVLLDKPARRIEKITADYSGFEIPDEFVIGYGLDLDEYYRNLPDIMIAKKDRA
ncbi:MAG: hypoxanthine phosphoribosyltransferase [Lentisphaerae bacterium GWF2_45_14]|nr:MAG: hypoxanthine phosphoribosyltransferase [Lentisphaerae bacterium GWF2_45_14]